MQKTDIVHGEKLHKVLKQTQAQNISRKHIIHYKHAMQVAGVKKDPQICGFSAITLHFGSVSILRNRNFWNFRLKEQDAFRTNTLLFITYATFFMPSS